MSTNAEYALLGCVLAHAENCRDVIAEIEPGDMWDVHCRSAWRVIRELDTADAPVNLVTVGDGMERTGGNGLLDGGPRAWLLRALSDAPIGEQAAYYAGLVRAAATKRRLGLLLGQVGGLLAADADVDACLAAARDGIAELETLGHSGGPVSARAAMGAVLEAIDSRAEKPEDHAIMTGLDAYDSKVGGLRRGNLIVVAGPPGMGKTAWGISVAHHAAVNAGVPTLVVSLEMDVNEVLERFLAQNSGVPGQDMATGAAARNRASMAAISKSAVNISKRPLWVEDRNLPMGRIIAECRKWYARNVTGNGAPMGLIIIDYLGLIVPDVDDSSVSRANEVAKMTRAFKSLAKNLRCPVVLLSQLNRQYAQTDRPQLPHLRDSGAIEQDANLVIFPWRCLDADEGSRNDSGPAEWLVAKNRNGMTGAIHCHWNAPLMRFVDAE